MPSPKYHIRITGALGCLVILLPIIITTILQRIYNELIRYEREQ